MKQRGILIVISGFSGAGKGTLVKALVERFGYTLSISTTTRAPRINEVHGREYYFTTKEAFEEMLQRAELIEWAEYVGNYYGTPKKYVEDMLAEGKDVILEIETRGAFIVREQFPQALLIFVTAPTVTELKRRLEGRGTEPPEKVRKRLQKGIKEIEEMNRYDYILINDDLERCVEMLQAMIRLEHYRPRSSATLIHKLRSEFDEILKGE